MQFFDYDEDLRTFNSLMEANKKATPEDTGADKAAAGTSGATQTDATNDKFKSSTITDKIRENLEKSEKLNYKLFCATYWPETYSHKFLLGKSGNYIVMNDPLLDTEPPAKMTDDKHISINLSSIINHKTSGNMAKKLVGIQDLRSFAAQKNSPYSTARSDIIDKQLSKLLDSVLDPDYEEKQLKKQQQKEARQKAKEEKQNAQEEQNKQGNPDENNPQDQQQQNPQDQKNNPDTPSDEDDPKALYRKIRKNFQDNYKDDLQLYCQRNADELDDEGKDALVDEYYDKAMEDFPDVYDNDVQEKVQDLVASYVDLYTKTDEKKSKESNDPDDDDMNWGPKKKPDDNQSNDNTSNSKPNDKPEDKGYFNWLNNTINNWNQEGVLNQTANPKKNIESSHFIKDAKDWLDRRRKKKGTSESNRHQDTDKILDED